MLIPVFEAYGTIDSYAVSATLKALITKSLTDQASLDLNYPYGNQPTGFEAGMIAQLASESNATVVELSNGVAPVGIFADSLTDVARSYKGSFYYLCQNVKVKVKTNYDTTQSYPVNTLLTTIPSGVNQGKLTPTGNYSSQPVVGIVMEAPSNAANDEFMIIMTDLQY
jgi:hypothetical protein